MEAVWSSVHNTGRKPTAGWRPGNEDECCTHILPSCETTFIDFSPI